MVAIVKKMHMIMRNAIPTKLAFCYSKKISIRSKKTLPVFFSPTNINCASNLNHLKSTFVAK
jgi:hypothetical protein